MRADSRRAIHLFLTSRGLIILQMGSVVLLCLLLLGGGTAGNRFTATLQEPRYASWTAAPSSTPRLVVSGSGFWVSQEGHIVTSAHVVDECRKAVVWGVDGQARKSDIVGFDRPHDLALLRASGDVPEVARIADWQDNPPRRGDQLMTIGLGQNRDEPLAPRFTTGRLLGFDYGAEGRQLLRFKAALHGGNSGAPLLSNRGEVLGMVIGRYAEWPEQGIAIPAPELRRFLDTFKISYAIAHHTRGSEDQITRFLWRLTVLVQCQDTA
jgi:S1-C subfamily serine protease